MTTASLIISILAVILGIIAIVRGELHTRETRWQLDGSQGTPAVEVQWGHPSEGGLIPCRVTALFNRVTAVTIKIGRESKTIDELAANESKSLEFVAVPQGTKFKLSFADPVERRGHRKQGVVRYGQLDMMG